MSNTFFNSRQLGKVSSFSALINTDFKGERNALCWYRNLEGDFAEIVAELQLKGNITEVSPKEILALQLSEKGNIASTYVFSISNDVFA